MSGGGGRKCKRPPPACFRNRMKTFGGGEVVEAGFGHCYIQRNTTMPTPLLKRGSPVILTSRVRGAWPVKKGQSWSSR